MSVKSGAARFRTGAPLSSHDDSEPWPFKSRDFRRLNMRWRIASQTGMDIAKWVCKRLELNGKINDY
jgi:hypothetical protein